ncbi:MAG TPA: hypothetical protein VGX68_20235 [Thermoanaerobaculia bacterium]|jgi:hypothetical protein|nr:hypothetical protein [Thermoanaerobaculia bacterium]
MRIRIAFAGFLLLLGFASSGMAQRVVATGREIQDPQVAVAGTGDFMIVWSDLDSPVGSAPSFGVFGWMFEASGKPKGRAFRVHRDPAGDQILPQVAADEQGNFVVVWQGGFFYGRNLESPGGDGNGTGVFAQRFDRSGARQGAPLRLSRSAAGNQITPNVAMSSDGSFTAVWQHCTPRCSELHVGRFTAGGERMGETLEIPALTATYYESGRPAPNPTPSVTTGPAGFAIGFTEQEACYKFEFEKFPVIVRFTDSGRPAGEKFRLDDGMCEDATGWELAALTVSRTGSSAAFFNGERNSFQLFGSDGALVGPRTVVGKRNRCGGNGCESIDDAAMSSDGGFVALWHRFVTVTEPKPAISFLLEAQFFDPLGRPLGQRVRVASTPFEPFRSAAAFANDGSLLVVWAQPDGYRSAHRLLVRRIQRN